MVQFNERATPLQTFTNDLALLEKAIRATEASGPTALHNALYVALKDLGRDKKAAELRRRAIVILSDGEDTASLVTDDQVLELAKKSEINIYAISLRPQRAQDRQRQAFSQAEYLLNALTRETGGRAYFPTSIGELDSVYDRIAEELRTLYSVGYVSANAQARRQVAADRGARARSRGAADPPQARLLRAARASCSTQTRTVASSSSMSTSGWPESSARRTSPDRHAAAVPLPAAVVRRDRPVVADASGQPDRQVDRDAGALAGLLHDADAEPHRLALARAAAASPRPSRPGSSAGGRPRPDDASTAFDGLQVVVRAARGGGRRDRRTQDGHSEERPRPRYEI